MLCIKPTEVSDVINVVIRKQAWWFPIPLCPSPFLACPPFSSPPNPSGVTNGGRGEQLPTGVAGEGALNSLTKISYD